MGKCHLCQERKEIFHCATCGHWFCAECKGRWLQRGVSAIKHLLGEKTPDCCGP